MSPKSEKAFKNVDYFFKIISWEILAAGIQYASHKLESNVLFALSFVLQVTVGLLIGYIVPDLISERIRLNKSDRPLKANWIFVITTIVSLLAVTFVNYKLQLEIRRFVALGK